MRGSGLSPLFKAAVRASGLGACVGIKRTRGGRGPSPVLNQWMLSGLDTQREWHKKSLGM